VAVAVAMLLVTRVVDAKSARTPPTTQQTASR